MPKDYYETLGVSRDASEAELRQAYREMAKRYHPDRNPGDAEAETFFKEVNAAHEVLSDEQKRAAYDRFGHEAFENGDMRTGRAGFGFAGGADRFSDLFEGIFGEFSDRGGRRQQSRRGQDLRYNLGISLVDAFRGREVEIRVSRSAHCDSCSGIGTEGGTEPVTCQTCGGAGAVHAKQGFFTVERPCSSCRGAGRIIEKPCQVCGGAGQIQQEKTLSATIPPGVDDDTRIRLSGEGDAGFQGGPSGDVYIFLQVEPHPFFGRKGSDLFCEVPVSMVTATLGGSIEVPTVDGAAAKVKIPEGIQTGEQRRLRGKGMPELRSSRRGDMYILTRVETPVGLTSAQKKQLRKFEEMGDKNSVLEDIFAKTKEFSVDATK